LALGRTFGRSTAQNPLLLLLKKPLILELFQLLTALGLKSSAPREVTIGTPFLDLIWDDCPRLMPNRFFTMLFFFAISSLLWFSNWEAVIVGVIAEAGWSTGLLTYVSFLVELSYDDVDDSGSNGGVEGCFISSSSPSKDWIHGAFFLLFRFKNDLILDGIL